MRTCLANTICLQSHDEHMVRKHVGSTANDVALEFRTVAGRGARGLMMALRCWSVVRAHTPTGLGRRVEGFGTGLGRCWTAGSCRLALSSSSHCCSPMCSCRCRSSQ